MIIDVYTAQRFRYEGNNFYETHVHILPRYPNKHTIPLQLCADGKQLLDTLQTPVSSGSSNSITAKADYTEGAAHVLDVVHEVKKSFLAFCHT